MAEAVSSRSGSILLRRFMYFTERDKIVLDIQMSQPGVYELTQTNQPSQVIVDLPGVDGSEFYTNDDVNDTTLYRVTVEPLPSGEGSTEGEGRREGTRITLSLRYKVPQALAFQVNRGKRLLIEVKKEFSRGFETFVAPGVAYGHWRKGTPDGPLFVNYARIDLQQPGVTIRPVLASGGREPVHKMAVREGALLAVNGIYFGPGGQPLGLVIIDGKLISPPYFNRTAFGLFADGDIRIDNVAFTGTVHVLRHKRVSPVDADVAAAPGLSSRSGEKEPIKEPITGESLMCHGGALSKHEEMGHQSLPFSEGEEQWEIAGVNRIRYVDELIVYTPEHGPTTGTNEFGYEVLVRGGQVIGTAKGNAPIPPDGYVLSGHGKAADWLRTLEIGEYIEASWHLQPDWLKQGVVHALGGGPRLLRAGKINITGTEERFRKDITQGRAPRTALGVTAQGELLLVTVNGRQNNISIGMTLEELARLMQRLGAVEAMNLDGGGSSTMVVRGIVLNAPSDGKPRPVSNALLVWAPAK